ncbi:MAG: hypothetical protein ABH808_03860 [Candidatus Kuenenbacteria bacterium]
MNHTKVEQKEKGNGVITEMEKELNKAILKRNFNEYYKWLNNELVKKEKEIIYQDQFKIFERVFNIYIIPEKVKENLLDLFQESFTENKPIIQCKIFEGLLEGIFLQKQREKLKNKLKEQELFERIDSLYLQQQTMKDGEYEYKICFSSFVMLIMEIAREHGKSVSELLDNYSPTKSLEIIDENLINKLKLHGLADTKKKPKLLIGSFIRAIWERVEKIDERFSSIYRETMYRNAKLPFERYPKVTDPENIIGKLNNVKKYSKDFDPTYLERWLNYLRGKQEVERAKLEVVEKPFLEVLEDLENRASEFKKEFA